nr:hypothetical protein [Tanacetum cinerariifolium]
MKFLGHVINCQGVHVDQTKAEAIKSWTALKSPTEVRQFLGLAGYYRRTPSGYDSIWVIVDRLAKSAHFLPKKKSDSIEKLVELYLKEIVCRHGVPVLVIFDRDSLFTSSWDKHLPLVEFSSNNSYHASIKAALFEALTPSGYDSIWVIVDRLAKSAHFLPKKKSDSIEKLVELYLKEIVCRHGVPVLVIFDRDSLFTSSWDKHLPLVEFSSNNSYHASIKAALFEALSRKKSYADLKRRLTEFEVGDKVMLKVSPWRGVIRFGKCRKLSPQFIGLFKVIERIGPVAYKLELPDKLRGIHDTFHVSDLKRCFVNDDVVILLDEVQLDEKLHFVKKPVEIMDREVKRLKQSRIPIVKVRWNSRQGPEFTWEREDFFRSKYPHLFARRWVTRQGKRRDVAS